MNSSVPTEAVESSAAPGELESLYLEFVRRFYEEGDREQARALADRLEAALAASPEYARSIRGEEVRSLIAELGDDLPRAIQSREAEIRKILELHAGAWNTPSWGYVSKLYNHGDVSDRLDLLAILYDRQGEVDRAIAVLLESKAYCESRRIRFDAQDLLDELEQDRRDEAPRAAIREVPQDRLDDAIRATYEQFGESADEILVIDEKSRRFAATVNRQLPEDVRASIPEVKRRLLTLRRRGEARGGLPRLKR